MPTGLLRSGRPFATTRRIFRAYIFTLPRKFVSLAACDFGFLADRRFARNANR
jgi:hypothetical protein